LRRTTVPDEILTPQSLKDAHYARAVKSVNDALSIGVMEIQPAHYGEFKDELTALLRAAGWQVDEIPKDTGKPFLKVSAPVAEEYKAPVVESYTSAPGYRVPGSSLS
jgi:hypothetical protein